MSAVKSEAMNQRFHRAGQYCTELQEELSEANNKICRAVLVCPFFLYYSYIFTAFASMIVATVLRKKPSCLPKCGHWRRNWKNWKGKWQGLIKKTRYHHFNSNQNTQHIKFQICRLSDIKVLTFWLEGTHILRPFGIFLQKTQYVYYMTKLYFYESFCLRRCPKRSTLKNEWFYTF